MNQAPGIKKLPVEQGKMFYTEAGRRGQLRQVEQEGFVTDKVGGERSGTSIDTYTLHECHACTLVTYMY